MRASMHIAFIASRYHNVHCLDTIGAHLMILG